MRIAVVVAISVAVVLAGQKTKERSLQERELTKRQRELLQLQRTIQQRERVIAELAAKQRTHERATALLRTQIEQQRRFQRLLAQEIRRLTHQEHQLQSERSGYSVQLERDFQHWQRFLLALTSAQVSGDDHTALDTAVLAHAARRLRERIAQHQAQHDSTAQRLERLERYRAARQMLLAQQQKEQQRLERSLQLRSRLLEQLRRDRSAVERELRTLRASMKTIEQQIARLSRRGGATPKSPAQSGSILPSLQVPVRGAILRGYGEYRHPLTGAKAFNAGVDIAVPVGTPVQAAAAGTVVSVQWLPAMNNVVIIEHEGGVRTVYANLDRVMVRRGEKVSSAATIGTSGETLSGAFVHFELWRGRERIDPTFVIR